jgi:hypothetical protein
MDVCGMRKFHDESMSKIRVVLEVRRKEGMVRKEGKGSDDQEED